MKKKLVFVFAAVLWVYSASALSSTIGNSYAPRQTIIAELSQDIIGTISPNQINLLRNGYIDVGFEYGIKNMQGKHYLWLIAPQNSGNYTLKIEDVVVNINGVPEVVDYTKNFIVNGTTIDYAIKPGVISASEDFEITVNLYEDFSKTVSMDFPEQKDVLLIPGENKIDFSVAGLFGTQIVTIHVGSYAFPAQIIRPESVCGDDFITGAEVCDGDGLGGAECVDVNQSYIGGNLSCSANCLSYDENECLQENNNSNDSGEVCGPSRLDLCLAEPDCEDVDGHWYNGRCNLGEEGEVCDSAHKELCLNPGDCVEAGGYWYEEVCNYQKPEGELTKRFEFNPTEMNITVLVTEELPSYTFRIRNTGEVPIENLSLDYNRAKFIITPEEDISIGVNESAVLSLSFSGQVRGETRGAIVASSDEIKEYLLVTVRGTENPDDVKTDYGGGGLSCSQLDGAKCDSDEVCSSSVVNTAYTNACCTGLCQSSKTSGGSYTWIGYLIAGIIVVGGLIVYLKYRKTGKSGNAVKQRFASAEKKLP